MNTIAKPLNLINKLQKIKEGNIDVKNIPSLDGVAYFAMHINFPSLYGASIISKPGSYGYEQGLYELAVLYDGIITYNTDITDNVVGYITEDEAVDLVKRISKINDTINLYHISQHKENSYDTYDSFVVASESEEKAKMYHPSRGLITDKANITKFEGKIYSSDWIVNPDDVIVTLVGVADQSLKEGQIIISSYNAG